MIPLRYRFWGGRGLLFIFEFTTRLSSYSLAYLHIFECKKNCIVSEKFMTPRKNKNPGKGNNKPKGRATKIDEKLGHKLRVRRNIIGMSQERLADLVGLTFQQIQKYESGKNRISASRLLEISKILDVPVTYFYENLNTDYSQHEGSSLAGFSEQNQENFLENDQLTDKETLELVRIYYSIKDPELRKNLLNFIKSMAENLKAQENELDSNK